MPQYDVAVIGSGPGGYVAAIRCAQLGKKTALIEKYDTLGGTCLNVGCIPSKALLDSSEHFHKAMHEFATHGIKIEKPQVDWEQMLKRKNEVVSKTCDGIKFLMKKNKIDVYHGIGSFIDKNTLNIKDKNGKNQQITSDKVIIATGSKPIIIPGVEYDKKRVITSTEALSLPEIPKTMLIIGGGVIGLELGSVFARLGTKIIVVEFLDAIIASMDRTLGKELQKSLKKLGFEFHFNTKVTSAKTVGDQVHILAESKDGSQKMEFKTDYCLVSVGRRPYTDGLELEKIGVQVEKGRIVVDDHLETTVKGIYAIGDVVRGAMLAHKAEEEGVFVAETIAGQKPHINYKLIPGVVYTWPEVASVGYTEEELKQEGRKYKVGSFPMMALGRAR
ncbi:MAG: dihydrolipoyl dehydrogenase, partial [Bacteroidia bacterium]|nr:dihydrolipoyl dehydrogenase [Bacteroidia bacterium]